MASSSTATLAQAIDAALPQTQCTRCGYPDCAGYAAAIASEGAPINQCPPGGAEGIRRLAALTGRPVLALNPANGVEAPRALAVIDEDWCIGCTLCLKACPTDAILGGPKTMHVVIDAHCTGCELCLPVCPVDCIAMVPASGSDTGWDAWSAPQADHARRRYEARTARLERQADEDHARRLAKAEHKLAELSATPPAVDPDVERKRRIVAAAIERARQRNGDTPTD